MKYTKLLSIISIVVVILFLVSCSPLLLKKTTDDSATAPTETQEDLADETEVVVNQKPTITVVPPTDDSATGYSAEIQELMDKNKKVKSYKYIYDVPSGDSYEYYVSGDKAKKKYISLRKSNLLNVYYDEVYLYLNTKKAYASCTLGASSCVAIWKRAYPTNFDKQVVSLTPLDLVNSMGYDARKVGEEVIDNIQTVVVEHTNKQGKKERLWLDTFYGMPMKQIIYDGVEGAMKEEKHTFTRLIVDVLESEVTMPVDFQIQNETIQ